MNIPILDLKREYEYMKKEIDQVIGKCLEHQRWILGPEVKELEEKVAAYLSSKHCIGVSSGTEALVLSLRALAIKTKGKEYFDRSDMIITTPFTFTATGDAILRSGATPLFVDIDPATFNIDVDKIKECLVSDAGPGITGIIPVHLYGRSCDMDTIMSVAKENDAFVVEDVAQAFGGDWKGKKLGSIGDLGAFSFFPSKNLGGFGDGGIIATNNDELFEIAGMLRKHGGKDKYNVDHIGYNARLDTLQAAVILAKMKFIDEFNEKRKNIAKIYDKNLSDRTGMVLPRPDDGHVYHQYTVRISDGRRNELQAHLKESGIGTMIYYPVPLHEMRVFEGRSNTAGDLEESEKASKDVLSLPVEPLLTEKEIAYVCDKILEEI